MSSFKNPAWLPFSVSEAATAGDATDHDLDSGQAWNHLLDKMRRIGEVVLSDSVPNDPVDMASGFRHLLVLLGVGIDELLRRGLEMCIRDRRRRSKRGTSDGHGQGVAHRHRHRCLSEGP